MKFTTVTKENSKFNLDIIPSNFLLVKCFNVYLNYKQQYVKEAVNIEAKASSKFPIIWRPKKRFLTFQSILSEDTPGSSIINTAKIIVLKIIKTVEIKTKEYDWTLYEEV